MLARDGGEFPLGLDGSRTRDRAGRLGPGAPLGPFEIGSNGTRGGTVAVWFRTAFGARIESPSYYAVWATRW